MGRTRLFVLLIIIFVLQAQQAAAQQHSIAPKVGYHHFLFPGESETPDGDGVLEDGEFDGAIDTASFNGWTFEVEYDYSFFSVFSLATSLQWYGGSSKWAGYADGAYIHGDMMLTLTNFLITPKLHLPLDPFDLYTGAGVGVYWLVEDFTFEVDRESGGFTQHVSDSKNRLGYHLQIGFQYSIKKWAAILIEDRFAFARFYGSDPTTNFDELEAGGNSLLLGARFSF